MTSANKGKSNRYTLSEQDFNRIKEISKELNNIRLRNNLSYLELITDEDVGVRYSSNDAAIITRGVHFIGDAKEVIVRWGKGESCGISEDCVNDAIMDYRKYMSQVAGW